MPYKRGRSDQENRRSFLKTAGTLVGGTALAGCSGRNEADNQAAKNTDTTEPGTVTSQKTDFPTDPITFIVPYGAGGGFDFYARTVAKFIEKKNYLPTQVNVKNVEGATGIIGGNRVYTADPDGYTNGIWASTIQGQLQIVRPEKVKYDLQNVTPYPSAAGTLRAVAVRKGTGITTAKGFFKAARNGKLTFGATGPLGGARFILAALGRVGDAYDFKKIINNFVYFDGKGPWYTAVKRGDVDVMAGSYSSLLPFVKDGGVNMVLTLSMESSSPEPTSDAATLRDVDLNSPKKVMALSGSVGVYRVFAGPPDIPEDRSTKIRTAIRKALKDPDLQQAAKDSNRPINFINSEEAGATLSRIIQTWTDNKDLLTTLKKQK